MVPSVYFSRKMATHNHRCNEDTMEQYITRIIFPYLEEKKASLGLPASQSSLVTFDEFTRQIIDKILSLLHTNNVHYVIVPPNCIDTLQSLDVSD